jgi:excinuclease ABC subunit A
VTNSCPQCHGKRYLDKILDVTYRDANIVDVLNMSVSDAAMLFRDTPSIQAMLSVLEQTGMGYITLGQPTNTLSGGEAQRIKLAKEIGRRRMGSVYPGFAPSRAIVWHVSIQQRCFSFALSDHHA